MIKVFSLNSSQAETELCRLCKKHNSDKFETHKYTHLYYELLKDWKNRSFNMLEIGIANGASIRVWHDFFPYAKIHCVDIEKTAVDKVKNINRVFAHQLNAERKDHWENILSKNLKDTKFDLIIDDGGHYPIEQWVSFTYLKEKLNTKGFYIVEDLHAPWAFVEERHAFLDYLASFMAKNLINESHEYEFFFRNKLVVIKKQN